MNILQILPALDVGGVETGTIDLSKELIKRGHRAIVVSNGGTMVRDLMDAGARHIQLPVHEKSLFTVVKMVKKLERIMKEERIDVVHARSRVPALIAFFAARHTNASFITTAHGYYSRHFLSRVMGWGKFVIVASGIVGRHMIGDFGVPHERIRFIPRGVDLERFRFNPPDTTRQKAEYKIGIIGRITPIKGHIFFLQAIAKVVRIFPNVKILIVGDSPKNKPEYKKNLKVLISKLNIERFVELLGSQQDIPKIMSGLDLLVLPSVGQEAFGRVIVEAGASGVPVISTRIGGAVDIIEDGKTGLLVKPGDIMEIVNSIIRLLKDRNLAKDLAFEARRKVEKEYSLDRMVDCTIKVYDEACNKKRILVIKIGAIGDVILSVPSLRAIRNAFPNAFISVLVGAFSGVLLKRCPYIDDIILYHREAEDKGIGSLWRIGSIIRGKAFDMSIDLQNNKASHIVAWLGAVPRRFGYDNKKFGFLLNNRLRHLKIGGVGPVEEQFRVLKRAGINTIGASRRLEAWPGKEDFIYIDNLLKNEWVRKDQVLVGINIGGSWKTKRWPIRCFAKLSDMLAAKDIRVIVTGSKEEKSLVRDFMNMTHNKVIDASGKTTITQLAALIKKCKVFVTGDSAPMHVASGMDTNFIALFGPTDPRRHFEPIYRGTIIKKELSCSPCYKSDCKRIRCMEKIGVEEVFKLVMEKISNDKSQIPK
ncbi:MAG: lipopolysaccharide heptosyltransferase II [Candidatus Omnitrophica bacterium]|nr:lipopolysaccharide heptosyltransferase II [Candidatus Omnitrophota bacterium]MBU1853821.1 lipopolysaccharide heptosyltransferase II [Candidatus Omnitrophota bacterium]